ncbi:MupA/Atu3671 family FMN-dependent luciferase-like monooxygenase [Chitinophaga sp.]|uniref:MupA/Atu3671 family FMN-dependent luciferase-like monooxygenase n=1 Tax=Chitinophaga sp. TaxID=1869181 RepID=UPI0031D84C2B
MGDLTIKQKLTLLIQAGLLFEVAEDKLQIRGRLDVLSEDDKQFLRENKGAIIALISQQTATAPVMQQVDRHRPLPLSFSQQSLWLLDRINEGSSHYNQTSAFRLKGVLDYRALDRTFLTILQRHESLRSSFQADAGGEPVQTIQEVTGYNVPVEHITEEQIGSIIQEEAKRVFDLTKDLLLHVRLLKINEEEHILIANMHHIASDGWSIGIFVKEISVLYGSYTKGATNPLAPLTIQYPDYAHWQRQSLKGATLETLRNYWKQQLEGLPVLHNLPLDKPRPLSQRFKGSLYTSVIPKNLQTALAEICQAESASLFMGVHAAFSTLLARYSNEYDIVIGCPVANREHSETAGLIGFFMNLLVLRSDLSARPGFRTLLRQSKQMLEDAYQHQQMPFELLADELKVQRNLSYNPLFQILLSFHNNQQGQFALPGMTMEPVLNSHHSSAKYDLTLNVTERGNGLHLSWEYNTDLFEADTIVRMAAQFETLLGSMLENPEENVFKLPMTTGHALKGESVTIIHEDHFARQVKERPADIAVISNDEQVNYQQLGERVDAIASLLKESGLKQGDKAGLYLLRNADLVATIFACLKTGVGYIPLDPVYSSEKINQIITEAAPKVIVTISPLKTLFLRSLPATQLLCLDEQVFTAGTIHETIADDTAAYVIFTSGTTGKPKGIEVTHGNLKNFLQSLDGTFGSEARQRWLAQTSVNFDISVLEIIWTISRGHTIVLQQSDPLKILPAERLEPSGKMDFSIMFFGADKNSGQKYDLLFDTARYADQHGFTAIWTPERHFSEFGGVFASPGVLGASIASITKNIGIRAGSVVLPLHDPVRVAEEWSVIDNVSNGRIGLSIASGWHPNDFIFYNANYKERHREMRERIQELKALWRGVPVTRINGIGRELQISIRPTPIQQELPIWVTAAGSPETFRYAGEIGAHILTHMLGQTMEKLAANIAIYQQALKDHGHELADKKVSLMLHTYIATTDELAATVSEQPFKDYLASSLSLMEPLAKEIGLDINTQREELIEIAYKKFSRENTLIGTAESCQHMLHQLQKIGVNEIACLVDFGIESSAVLDGLANIVVAKHLYEAGQRLVSLLHTDKQRTALDLISEYSLTHVQMTPSQCKLVYDLYQQKNDNSLSSLQRWLIGGEAVNRKVISGLQTATSAAFYNMYGPTETTVWSAWRKIHADDIAIGGPVYNTDLLLLNEYGQQVPVGVVGELYIGGAGVAKGYYGNPTLTAQSFVEINGGRYYKTGDLMRLKADHTLEYIGRKDNQVKVNGYRIETDEIEGSISQLAGVKNCKVVPVKTDDNTYLAAYVVRQDNVYGEYTAVEEAERPGAFHFPDGSVVYHQSDRQLTMLYKEVIERGIYFRHGITVPENGLVLDLGANVGTFSIDVNQRVPGAAVIAFEPIPQLFAALQKNFEHRQIKGLLLNYGVSNKQEQATFHYYPEMAGMSGRFADKDTILQAVSQYIQQEKADTNNEVNHLSDEDRTVMKSFYQQIDGQSEEIGQYLSSLYASKEVTCQLTTVSAVIDELRITSIDLLKLDVEKSECLVLEGIRDEHWPLIHQLAVEVDGDANLDLIKTLLHSKGYALNVDELIMSDASTPQEANTYMLYAVQPAYRPTDNAALRPLLQARVSEPIVREHLKRSLPDYMTPAEITFVPSIPLMENGKADIQQLKKMKPQQEEKKTIVTITNSTELEIYRLWCEVLKKENIPPHVSIFEAGGNSIGIVLLHEKMKAAFNVDFSLIELFRNPTIQQQARLIQQASHREPDTIKKATEKGAARRNVRAKQN